MNEEFIDIKDYEGLYSINTAGLVRSKRRQGTNRQSPYLKHTISQYGYPLVTLCKDAKSRPYLLHRLVASAFIPNPENKPEVNHINGIKLDFSLDNLEWVTGQENKNHAVRNKLNGWAFGERSAKAKLTEKLVLEIRAKYRTGDYSTRQLAKEYGLHHSAMYNAIKGISWSHI